MLNLPVLSELARCILQIAIARLRIILRYNSSINQIPHPRDTGSELEVKK
jgi:hypothetical protein